MLLYSQVTLFILKFIRVQCTAPLAINSVCKKEYQAKRDVKTRRMRVKKVKFSL
jgi:hypothetical protein